MKRVLLIGRVFTWWNILIALSIHFALTQGSLSLDNDADEDDENGATRDLWK